MNPQALPTQIGPYTITDSLGSGGFGRVYAATSLEGLKVALKVVPRTPEAERELQFATLKDFPGVVPVLEHFEHGSEWVLVMPRADGSLRQHLQAAGGRLLEAEVIKILSEVVGVLAALYGQVVHRDLKPENVLRLGGRWCLADFGMARYAELSTAQHTFKYGGTPAYVAPERWRQERATSASDIYALGVMAFELLEGHVPFSGEAREGHLHQAPPIAQSANLALQGLIRDCLNKAPEARPTPARLLERLRTAPLPLGGAMGILQAAAGVVAQQQAVEDSQKMRQTSERDRRARLVDAAQRSLEQIGEALTEAIHIVVPNLQHAPSSRTLLDVTLGGGHLTLETSTPVPSARTSPKYGKLSFDVVATSSIRVLNTQPNRERYAGREHALWYGDLEREGEYRWYELAFMMMFGNNPARVPFALGPLDDNAVGALLPMVHTHQVAWSPQATDQGEHADFLERWLGHFAGAVAGGLAYPSSLPERPVHKTWRRST